MNSDMDLRGSRFVSSGAQIGVATTPRALKSLVVFVLLWLLSGLTARPAVWFVLTNAASTYSSGTWYWEVDNCDGHASSSSTYIFSPGIYTGGLGGSGLAWLGDGEPTCNNSWTFDSGTPPWVTSGGFGGFSGLDQGQFIIIDQHYAAPTTTNVTQCVQNTTGQNVTATATMGGLSSVPGSGTPVGPPVTLAPGQTYCWTATMKLDGSDGPFSVSFSAPNSSNPNNADGGTQSFNPTNGFTTEYSNNNQPTGGTGGGASTNVFTAYTTNFSQTIWSNNITWPTPPSMTNADVSAGLALDSTAKTGFGNLHNDNQQTLAQLKNMGTDLDGMTTMAQYMTNAMGQQIALLYHLTNADQLPVYVGTITNNATQNAENNANSINASNAAYAGMLYGAITNMQIGSPVVLSNVSETLTGMSNIWSQLADTTNGDFATETTQRGMSNLLSGLTNYATESTLEGISNELSHLSISNPINTNIPDYGGISGFTNQEALNEQVGTALANSGLPDTLNQMEGQAQAIDDGVPTGEYPSWDISASADGSATFHIDLMASPWADIWETVHRLMTLIICLLYAFYVVKCLYEQLQIWTGVNPGKVQPLEIEFLGTGGNVVGSIVYMACAAIFLLAFAGILAVSAATLTGTLSWSGIMSTAHTSSYAFGLVDSKAMYWLNACIPLAFLISMIVALLVWRLVTYLVTLTFCMFLRILPF